MSSPKANKNKKFQIASLPYKEVNSEDRVKVPNLCKMDYHSVTSLAMCLWKDHKNMSYMIFSFFFFPLCC
jgi:hypothetical protein